MRPYLILFYSKTGNSKFIANKLSHELACDSKEITPIFNSVLILYLLSLLKIHIPTNISTEDISKYDEVIIIGPIWGGLLISPLRTVLKKSIKARKNIHFSVTCETTEADKDSKFGYTQVLKKAGEVGGKFIKNTVAFSTSLVYFGNKLWKPKLSKKVKITEENFNDIIKLRIEDFAHKIKSS